MERETGLEPATPSLGSMLILLNLFSIMVMVSVFSTFQLNQPDTWKSNLPKLHVIQMYWSVKRWPNLVNSTISNHFLIILFFKQETVLLGIFYFFQYIKICFSNNGVCSHFFKYLGGIFQIMKFINNCIQMREFFINY